MLSHVTASAHPVDASGNLATPDALFALTLRRYAALSGICGCSLGLIIMPLTGSTFRGVELNGMLLWVGVALVFVLGLLRWVDSTPMAYYLTLAASCAGTNAITHSIATRDGSEAILTLFVILIWAGMVLPPHLMSVAIAYVIVAPWMYGGNLVPSTLQVLDAGDLNVIMLVMICTLGFAFSLAFKRVLGVLRAMDKTNTLAFFNTRQRLEATLKTRSEELDLSREHIIRAEKIRTVGTLAAGLAHELNNILTPARGFAELLASGTTSRSQTSDFGRRILDATIASTTITKALLTYTKQSIYSPEPVNLLNLLNLQIRPVLAQVIPDTVTLTVTCPRKLTLIVDAQLFQQSVTNLVLNAVDAMPRGGTITIEARQVPADDTERARAEIIVRDSGEGIAEDKLSQIFDPFFTTKKHGTGLGLPAVLGVMERHKGTINVTSAVGGGTTFTLTLPVATSIHHREQDQDFDSTSARDSARTAALLTHDEDLFDEVEEMMTDVDIELLRGPALEAITSDYRFDSRFSFVTLVLFDLDGWTGSFESAVEFVRERFPLVTLLAISSSPTSLAAIRRSEGRVSSLRKPIVQAQLNSRLAAFGTAVDS